MVDCIGRLVGASAGSAEDAATGGVEGDAAR